MNIVDALREMDEKEEKETKTYIVGFNGGKEARFDIRAEDEDKREDDLIDAWWDFSRENKISTESIDYIEKHENIGSMVFGRNIGMPTILTIINRNIDGIVITHSYKTLEDFESEWLNDDACISIGDELVCAVYKGIGYFGFDTIEDFCIAIPDLNEIVKF